jgi:hypothetical protein
LCPDSVIISGLAAPEAWETGISRATMRGQERWAENMLESQKAAEGLAAYKEKRLLVSFLLVVVVTSLIR